ncbi:MAG: type II secretion system F family protein [Chloroflexi bacterium]|nr:type II secretion system F family protein [Chloroflexota bacterium]
MDTLQIVIWVVVGLILVGGMIALIVVGNRAVSEQDNEEDPLMARLAEFSERGEVISLEQIELSQPFRERVILPMMRRFGELSARFTPQKVLLDTSKKLELAGNPGRLDAATFLAMRFVVPVIFDGFFLLIARLAPDPWPIGRLLSILVLFGLVGFFFPQLWLTSKIQGRQKEIRKAMPDALDLLTICVEAGLSFDSAMSKVSEKWENQLSLAFARAIREVQLGKLRREALRDMADRLGIAEMTSFVAAVIQSEQLGVSMAKVLRIQSEQMRMKRRQRAEEEAHKAPVKMIFPMGLLIFPSILIILLTPALIQITNVLGSAFR